MSEPYTGRMSFDPESNFHLSEDGQRVVTYDDGESWHYATDDDSSHFDRYHQQHVSVDSTANALQELQLEHGRVKAEEIMRELHPHHYEEGQ